MSSSSMRMRAGRAERLFYVWMALVAAAIVLVGFSRTYYLKAVFGRPPLPLLAHVHGALFTSWIVLFLVQASLIVRQRADLHRRLGVAGGALAILMVCTGLAMAIRAARRDLLASPGSAGPLEFLTIPFFDVVVFAILVAAAFYYRRKTPIHKRLMLIATITLLPPAISRFPSALVERNGPLAFFGLADLILLACFLYDAAVHRRVSPAYLWGGLLLVASHPLRLYIGGTSGWIVFARWLTGV